MVTILPRPSEAPAPVTAPAASSRPVASPQRVSIADVFDCTTEAAHRVGNGDAADFSCSRHRFEVVSAHWKREPNLPIYDLADGNGHVCNEARLPKELQA